MLDLADVVRPGVLRAAVQPVVRLADHVVIGYQALLRLPDGELPEDMLERATRAGVLADVEVASLRAAASLGDPPDGRLLFVRLGPGTLGHPGLLEVVGRLPHRLVLEVTGRQPPPVGGVLPARLAPLLSRGARLAVVDTGAGYAGLGRVVELRPEFLKLSGRLVGGLHRDPGRLALVRALAAFAREVGSSVVAEGVEREAERLALLAAGVEHAQGSLLARPGPPWPALEPRVRSHAPLLSGPRRRGLALDLLRCRDPRTACQQVVAHLARRPSWMPSVYLHVGGRLRLQAQQGYWHVFDGVPVTAGVLGRTFTSGRTNNIEDVRLDPAYVDAVPGLVSELSVPLRVDGRVVGVVNLESAVRLPASAAQEVELAATLLGLRLAKVGVPEESRARQLGRHTSPLTGAAARGDLRLLLDEATAAVRELSGLSSALVAGPTPAGLEVLSASGPLAGYLATLDAATLVSMRSGVSAGQTGYTAGVQGGRAPGTQAALPAAGVRTVVTLPVGDDHLLVGAARGVQALVAEDVEVLEVLAGQLAGCLQTVDAVRALHDRAERDPLTGLGNRTRFRRTLDGLQGAPFAVVYVDVDHFKQVNDERGHAEGDRLLIAVAEALTLLDQRDQRRLFRLGGDEFAALLPGAPRAIALERAEQTRQAVRTLGTGVTVSLGVAIRLPAEPVASVLARADAALYAASARGATAWRTTSGRTRRSPSTTPARPSTGCRRPDVDGLEDTGRPATRTAPPVSSPRR